MKMKIDYMATHSANSKLFLLGIKNRENIDNVGGILFSRKKPLSLSFLHRLAGFLLLGLVCQFNMHVCSCNTTTVPTCQLNCILWSISGPRKSGVQVACYRIRSTKNFLLRNLHFLKHFIQDFHGAKITLSREELL